MCIKNSFARKGAPSKEIYLIQSKLRAGVVVFRILMLEVLLVSSNKKAVSI